MPLSKAQIEFIEGITSHLLEFPAQKENLRTDIAQLLLWIEHPPANPDDNNIYQLLARCLYSPETSFQHLEDYGTSATIQDVQTCLISHITAALKKAADTAKTSLADIGWDASAITALLHHENASSLFKSIRIEQETALPWENMQEDGGMYCASLSFNEFYTEVLMSISITLPGKSEPVTMIEEFLQITPDLFDIHEDDLLESLILSAKQFARVLTADAVINELIRIAPNTALTIDYYKVLRCFPILAKQVIAAHVLQQKISLSQLTSLDAEQMASLSHPFASFLIDAEICTPEQAAAIPVITLTVMQAYSIFITQGVVNISDMTQLCSGNESVLMYPLIINLIHQNKLTFAIAAQLPPIIRPLLTSSLYSDFLLSAHIEWSFITRLKINHIDLLLRPDIANCIKFGLLTFQQVIYSNHQRLEKLRFKKCVTLLIRQTITLRDLDTLTVSKAELVNNSLFLRKSLRQKIISPIELNLRSPKPLYTCIFIKRLTALLHNKPYRFHHGKYDSYASLFSEIPSTELLARFAPGELRKNITEKIICYFKLKLETICQNDGAENAAPLHRKLLRTLNTLDQQHAAPETRLASLIDAANQYNKQPGCSILFFGRNRPDAEKFSELCLQLNSLRHYTEPPVLPAKLTAGK